MTELTGCKIAMAFGKTIGEVINEKDREIAKLREQRDYLAEFVKECEGYIPSIYYRQRVGKILAEIREKK